MQQGRYRRLICEEVYEMMIINRHIAYDGGILPEENEFWRFSDEAVEAINHMHFFVMATNYPLVYDLWEKYRSVSNMITRMKNLNNYE